MIIANGVAMLQLQIQGFEINPTLLWDEDSAVLIDTGMPGHVELIRGTMSEIEVPFDKLKAVILTHQDLDHIGGLPEIRKESMRTKWTNLILRVLFHLLKQTQTV